MIDEDEPKLFVRESFINATEHYSFGDSDIYEACTDKPGELFVMCQREYGRCVSKVYVDNGNGDKQPIHVGWVFQKKVRYEDVKEDYMREVWVTLYDKPDTVERTHHYHVMNGRK